MRKFSGVLVAAAMVLSVGMVGAPAGAAAAGPQCAALATKTVKSTITATVSKCTPAAATGGTGTGKFTSNPAKAGTLLITITWAAGHGTTKGTVKFTTAKTLGKCPKTSTGRIALGGSISGGTGTAVKTIKAGQKIVGSVCQGKTSITLEPGTVLKI